MKVSNQFFWRIFSFLLIALILIIITELIPNSELVKDRHNYFKSIENSVGRFSIYIINGIFFIIANEPLWVAFTILMKTFFGAVDSIYLLSIGVFLSLSFLISKRVDHFVFIMLLILLNPILMDKYVIHLRQGLAISVAMLFWGSNDNQKKSFFGLIISSFIHSSFFIITFFWILSWVSQRSRLPIPLVVLFGAFCSAIISIYLLQLSAVFGARQSEFYSNSDTFKFGFGFLTWIVILVLFLIQNKSIIRENIFLVNLIVFYLVCYNISPIIGARIFESGLVFILIYLTQLPSNKFFNIIFLLFYTLMLWFSRLDEPLLGFGV
jgi:hypothetical protein